MDSRPTAKKKIGRYILGERVGSGAGGGVYVAWAENSDRVLNRYAIKIHPLMNDLDRDALDGFTREATILTKLTHNNFTKFHEFGALYDCRYIVMEYVDGITLKAIMEGAAAGKYTIPIEHVLFILCSLAGALNYLTQVTDIETNETKSILHGDLTPDNVMLTTNGETKIIDFGVSHILSQTGRESRRHDHGKVKYISPKRAMGGVTDWQEDLFALGVMAYEMVTGHRFYGDASMEKISEYLQNYNYVSQKMESLKITPALKNILKRMVAADKSIGAYSGVDEFNRELQVLFSQTKPGYINKDMAEFLAKNFSKIINAKRALGQAALNQIKDIRAPLQRPLDQFGGKPVKIQYEVSSSWLTWVIVVIVLGLFGFTGWRISDCAADLLSVGTDASRPTLVKFLVYEILQKPLTPKKGRFPFLDPASARPEDTADYLLIKTNPPGADVYVDNLSQNVKTPIYIKLSSVRPSLVSVVFGGSERHTQLVAPGATTLNVIQGAP